MAILTVDSDLLATGFFFGETPRKGGTLRTRTFTRTIPAEMDIASTFRMGEIPQHGVLLPHLSYVRCTATALLTVSLGWEAYLDMDSGLTVPADPDGLGTTLTIAAGTLVLFSAFPAAPIPRTFNGPAVLTFLTAGAAIAVDSVVSGCIVYADNY